MRKLIDIARLGALCVALWPLYLAAEATLPAPNWTRADAVRAVADAPLESELAGLFALARDGRDAELLGRLREVAADAERPAPARDALLHGFTLGLGDLAPRSVSDAVLDFLVSVPPATRVPHDDYPLAGVPMWNVAAAARGVLRQWSRAEAAGSAARILPKGPEAWLSAYRAAGPERQPGYLDALDEATPAQLSQLATTLTTWLPGDSGLTPLAARTAALLGDVALIGATVRFGEGPAVTAALRAAARFTETERIALLFDALRAAPALNASLAIAELGAGVAHRADAAEALLAALQRPALRSTAALALLASPVPDHRTEAEAALQAGPGRLVEWVESAPVSDLSRIALGYPVPLPVDTSQPFDGFRSYAGLQARHQELAETTPWAHPEEIGLTRQGRPIMAWRLGDADVETARGFPEAAMLTNGGIHAREWQSPEVATAIMELLANPQADDHLVAYLRENVNVIVIPVLNVDGFLQTQRYPARNWLNTDPDDPDNSPRDGRMRRKNMLGADEDLLTEADHLLGVDLNRNNPPYWATTPGRSSNQPDSLVHHGAAPHSEPETQALRAAANLGPAARLSLFTDLHSFSQVHFWGRNSNNRLATQTERLLGTFSNFHAAFPAGKRYVFASAANVPRNSGIGTTDELFTSEYQVPSWTLEIEPSNGESYHAPLPGAGADYGGLGRNGHDGFILPEAEIARVRQDLAQTFAVAYYRQSGPPSVSTVRITDEATGAAVFEAEWDRVDDTARQLHRYQPQPLQAGRPYRAWIAWDKPMRWREQGEVTALPGQPGNTLDLEGSLLADGVELALSIGDSAWLDRPGEAPDGYQRYRDDAVSIAFRIDADDANLALLAGAADVTLSLDTTDMTGLRHDADPSTVARWQAGAWSGYEDESGVDGGDRGGADTTITLAVSAESLGDPFTVEPGTSSAWFDPERNGEGFVLEMLAGGRTVVYWFTYDLQGRQDWYVAEGEVRGNRILFPELLRVSGGEFGPGFDPDQVERTVVGSAAFTWASCDQGVMNWVIDGDGGPRRQGRMALARLSRVMGLPCGQPAPLPPEIPAGRLSGSWYDPSHSGEGFVLEVLDDQRILVYWFSYDPRGQRRWFFGTGTAAGGILTFEELYSTAGGVFGPGFDPGAVEVFDWGSLTLELDCTGGVARFEPREQGFPAGQLDLVRLSRLDGLSCED